MSSVLTRLMTRAMMDPREESAFFRALLEANVYAHIPLTDRIDARSDRIRFMQFHRPENGELVLPFFTDEAKARFAAQSAAQVIMMKGSALLTLTRGATLMIDPNDVQCVLYPEEVRALLSLGRIATIQKFVVEEKTAPLIGPLRENPAWLIDEATQVLSKLPFIKVAYLVGVYRRSEDPEQTAFLIALGGEELYAERAIHAVATALQSVCEAHSSLAVDLAYFDIDGSVPEWVASFAIEPFYNRDWGARMGFGTGQT